MKNLKKITAFSLAVAMSVLCSGCVTGDQSWSFKNDSASLTAGTYIYNLLSAYYEAYDMVESPDSVKNILKEEVSTDGASPKTVEQYAYDGAKEQSLRMMAVEALMDEYNLELNETEDQSYRSYAAGMWTGIKEQFEDYGISQDSFNYCYADYSVMYGQVFEAVYGENSKNNKAVSDDELVKFFKEKYTGYAYFSKSVATTNENGESVAMSDEEIAAIKKNYQGYVDALNKGTDYKEVVAKNMEDYDLATDPTYSGAIDVNDSTMDASLLAELKKLGEGKAALVVTGEGATECYYVLYRPTSDSIVDFIEKDSDTDSDVGDTDTTANTDTDSVDSNTDTASDSDAVSKIELVYDLKSGFTRSSLLDKYKGDDFKTFLDEYASGIKVEENAYVVGKYSPKMFKD